MWILLVLMGNILAPILQRRTGLERIRWLCEVPRLGRGGTGWAVGGAKPCSPLPDLGVFVRVPGAGLPCGVGVWGEFPGPFAVELSSLLVRNVNYEIPSLKKQIAKCQQLQQEYSRKEEEGHAGATEMREQFYHSCKQYGITVSRRAPGASWPEPSSLASGKGSLLGPVAPFLGQCLTHLQSPGIFFNPLGSASHHSCLSLPRPSSLGRQRPERTAGPGEGPAESAG